MQSPADPLEARRRRGLRRHFAIAFAVLAVAAVVGFLLHPPALPWIVAGAVVWSAPLAIHTAWAAGLFGPSGGGAK